MTVKLSAVCIVLSVLIGIVGAWLQRSRLRLTRHIIHWYIQFFSQYAAAGPALFLLLRRWTATDAHADVSIVLENW